MFICMNVYIYSAFIHHASDFNMIPNRPKISILNLILKCLPFFFFFASALRIIPSYLNFEIQK